MEKNLNSFFLIDCAASFYRYLYYVDRFFDVLSLGHTGYRRRWIPMTGQPDGSDKL
jgi:hypothetical protein